MNNAVAQMDKVTQENAATAEESASAAGDLASQSTQLNDMVGELLGIVTGGASGGAVQQQSVGRPAKRIQIQANGGRRQRALPAPRATPAKSATVLVPNEIIPLDASDDF